MELKQFLLARTAQDLTELSCTFELNHDDHLRCLCTTPSGEIDELFAQAQLINYWSELPTGQHMLRLLAERYAAHDHYRAEWRIPHMSPMRQRSSRRSIS